MRNHSFYELSKQRKYQEFNVKTSESGLYLSLNDKRLDTSSLFEEPEYGLFELDDIHVTVLEQYELSRKRADRGFKSNSPFHITLRFSEQDSERVIVIHDFYSPLDLSRDFHVQLKEGEVITYLPQQSIDLNKLNQLIDKEMRLVKELIDKNNKHEHDLRRLIDSTYEDLFSRAQQVNLLPDTMNESDYQHFEQSLAKIIENLEQLIYLGHHHESRRLSHAQRELEHLRSSQITPPEAQKAAADEKALTKVSKVSPQKSASKKDKVQKQKNKSDAGLTTFLNAFYAEVQLLKAQKNAFLEDIKLYLRPEPIFDPVALLAHLSAHLDILEAFSHVELEHLMMDFFEQFSSCRDLVKQTACREIAEFLSQYVPFFANFMLKLSLTSYEFSKARISGILMALFNNNVPYWAFMHSYGISFADNRHVIYDGIAGNILHGIFFLIKDIPDESIESIIPFVQLLFQYLEEDGSQLTNLKTISTVIPQSRKKTAAKTLFQKKESQNAAESDDFAKEIYEEPYGTVLIMNVVEAYLTQTKVSSRSNTPPKLDIDLLSKSVELMSLVIPHMTTPAVFIAFQRLLDAQILGLFDDHSFQKLLAHADLPPLERLTEFSIVYIGNDYKEPLSRLLDLLITSLTERLSTTSNSALSHMMQVYFKQSKFMLVAVPPGHSALHKAIKNDNGCEPLLMTHYQLTFARMAYFLFTIKARRAMFLSAEDYQILLFFYQIYGISEMLRHDKDNSDIDLKRRHISDIMEAATSAIRALDLPEVVASSEFSELVSWYEKFSAGLSPAQAEERTRGLGV